MFVFCGSYCQWIRGADLSLVTVGRSFTVAKGFDPLENRQKTDN